MRTDIHRPAAINPEDYEYVGIECLKIEDLGDAEFAMRERERIQAHMARTGGTYSDHAHGGNCHVCGASAIYTVLFHHAATNTYIRTGGDCAEKLDLGNAEIFRSKLAAARDCAAAARELKAGKTKAKALLAEAGLETAWGIYAAGWQKDEGREEETVRDIVGKLVRYGDMSDKQAAFLASLVDRIGRRAEIAAERAAEAEAAAPVPVTESRVKVRGKVLTKRAEDSCFGRYERTVIKVLVKHADGYKLWGNLPDSLATEVAAGDEIEFDARVKRSDKDPKFGFFSRPTKARKLAAAG
jgi:hypothetical protein